MSIYKTQSAISQFTYVEYCVLMSKFLLPSDFFLTFLMVMLVLLYHSDSFKLIYCHLSNVSKKLCVKN